MKVDMHAIEPFNFTRGKNIKWIQYDNLRGIEPQSMNGFCQTILEDDQHATQPHINHKMP